MNIMQGRLQWWIVIPGYFPFCKTFVETIEQQPTMGNPGAKIPRTAEEKEKNMAATSSPVMV